jgi:hypothetical protein
LIWFATSGVKSPAQGTPKTAGFQVVGVLGCARLGEVKPAQEYEKAKANAIAIQVTPFRNRRGML